MAKTLYAARRKTPFWFGRDDPVRIDVLGVCFDDVTLEEAAQRGEAMVRDGGFHYAVTPNPEFILEARRNEPFRQALLEADLVLPDGVGVTYAAKILGRPLKGRAPGIDFAQQMLDWMGREGKRLYLLGAKPGVAELAAANLKSRYPGLIVCGTHDGYFQEDGPVVEDIRAHAADVAFVCLGAPKQELWMARRGPECGVKLMIGLGGALDVFAGLVERAPEGFQKLGLEWFYRLVREPSRIGRMSKLPLVLWHAAGARIKGM